MKGNNFFKNLFMADKNTELVDGTTVLSSDNHEGSSDITEPYDVSNVDFAPAFSEEVLNDFRENVGKYFPETGGMLASTKDENLIDVYCFDSHSKNTQGSFYYDVESMTLEYKKWKKGGYTTNGIVHSHPNGFVRPSYHDISTSLLHMDFFKIDYFYLPIIQSKRNGRYTLYFYVCRLYDKCVEVTLEYVVYAERDGYEFSRSEHWVERYPISGLRAHQKAIDAAPENDNNSNVKKDKKEELGAVTDYFSKIDSLYPKEVRERKVIICIGTGGARAYVENMARSGFVNFVLIDADVVGASNVATQHVYINEIGRKKVEALRDAILNINPDAEVVCVDRFLDEEMTDEEFKGYLDMFPNRNTKDYLILGCTDNFIAQTRSSLLAMKYGTPYLAAMLYAKGYAAELIFIYPGMTESCPRCLLRNRFEKYENGYENDVDSSNVPIFATDRMNALKGYISLMLLLYKEVPGNVFDNMLDGVKNRNFVEIRLNPFLKNSELGIGLFDRVLDEASGYTFMDETLWIPQHPDRPEFGEKHCKLCGGTGHLEDFQIKWCSVDTRIIMKETGL